MQKQQIESFMSVNLGHLTGTLAGVNNLKHTKPVES